MTVVDYLRSIGKNPIMYENALPLIKLELLIDKWVKYVQDIIVARVTADLGMGNKEAIWIMSEIEQADSYHQE